MTIAAATQASASRYFVHPEPRQCSEERWASFDGWTDTDAELNEWMIDPAAIVDGNATPPSKDLIRNARALIAQLRHRGWPAPVMVVPDGNGGIAFEWHVGNVFHMLEINKDNERSLSEFRAGNLISRKQL
jgi:hypothetical protein